MNFTNSYLLTPLTKALRLLPYAPLMLVCCQAQAAFEETVIGETRNIDGSTMTNNWAVSEGGTLNATGARTGYIDVSRSNLNLTGTTVNGINGSGVGISLLFSNATIVGSSITGGETGMRIAGGKTVITGSTVTGTDFGIDLRTGTSAGTNPDLTLVGSQVNGTGPTGVGLHMFGGIVRATEGTVIQGTQNGITVSQGLFGETPTIDLDNSRVEGQTGSAIVVNAPIGEANFTQINVNNGSTLVGGNGTVLEVNGAKGKMNVSNSALTGNIQVRDSGAMDLDLNQSRLTGDISAEAGSTVNVALNNQSVFTGRLQNVNSLAVNSAAQWVMVEDSSVANLNMNGGAIKMGAPDAFYKLSVENLSGNGTFVMDADFSQGKVDFLDVTGTASGNHSLLVGATGADPVADSSLHVVHTAAGDAKFSLLNGPVDSPYGHRPAASGLTQLPGFSGERVEPFTGHYMLGNGYRSFNPVLMRFNSPDTLSPFGEGGLNAYSYCLGDPVNYQDPNGHIPWWVGLAAGVAAFVLTAGVAAPLTAAMGGIVAGTIAGLQGVSYAAAGISLVSGIASEVSRRAEVSDVFTGVSIGFGVLSGVAGGFAFGARLGALSASREVVAAGSASNTSRMPSSINSPTQAVEALNPRVNVGPTAPTAARARPSVPSGSFELKSIMAKPRAGTLGGRKHVTFDDLPHGEAPPAYSEVDLHRAFSLDGASNAIRGESSI